MIAAYERYCEAYECWTTRQLEDFVKALTRPRTREPRRRPGARQGAREIIDGGRYMTLATADAAGVPWASPVWYAPRGYSELFWISYPDARHSRNLAERPQLSIVIFDSTVAPRPRAGDLHDRRGRADDGRAGGLLRPLGGRRAWASGRTSAAPLRLYRAVVAEHWMLGEGPDKRVARHSLARGR